MIEIHQIGSSLENDSPNDYDFLIVTDKPVDICIYTPEQWILFKKHGWSTEGCRTVIHPPKRKGDRITNIRQIL